MNYVYAILAFIIFLAIVWMLRIIYKGWKTRKSNNRTVGGNQQGGDPGGNG